MRQSYYQDDAVTIYHGDCREILPELPKVDLVLTDPPYNMKHLNGGGFAAASEFYKGGALDGLCDFSLKDYAHELRRVSEQLVAFHSRDLILEYATACYELYGNYDLHVWHKLNAIPFTNNTWKPDIEYIALGWAAKHHQPVTQNNKGKVFISGIMTENLHPAQKPVPLLNKYILALTPSGETILDPFLGSGTTAVAAKKLGRKCIGIEIEEKYCEIAANRCRQMVMELNV